MALNTRYAKVGTLTTAASGSTNKVTALCSALFDAIIEEVSERGTLTPKQQNKLATAKAHVASNIATLQTAVGL
jgi:hypothetical protein